VLVVTAVPSRLNAPRTGTFALVAAILIGVASLGAAQLAGYRSRRFDGPRLEFARPDDFDGGFQFCRVAFRNAADGDGDGWGVDWPRADENLSIRLEELTKTPVSMDESAHPKHVLMRFTDPELLHYPFVMMTEPGGAYLDDQEAAGLRNYLLKGGFLWADDFWGLYAFDHWAGQLAKALPSSAYPIVDLPLDHGIFHEVFTVPRVPQIPGIRGWLRTGSTSERGLDSAVPHARAVRDGRGRVMVLMTHNTDFGDAFEEEATNHEYFLRFSVAGYAFGINTLLYAMTH